MRSSNSSSPVIPKFSSSDSKNEARGRTRFAIFAVLGVHAGILLVLLMQGCQQEPPLTPKSELASTNSTPAAETANPPIVEATNAVETTNTSTPVVPDNSTRELAATNPPAVPAAGALEYTIAKGDTFSTLAKKFHVPVKAVAEANPGVEPTKLKIGQKIHLPPATEPTAFKAATINPVEGASGESIYTVKSGDGLLKIASQFGTTIDALRAANSLRTDRIYIGQKLKIPMKSPAQALLPQPRRQEPAPSQG